MEQTHERVNITLPSRTIARIARATKDGNRSRFIDTAVNFYLGEQGRKRLHDSLKEGALARAKRDQQIADEYAIFNDL